MQHPFILISCDPSETRDFSMFAAVINVADTPCEVFRVNVPSFWFPIHETGVWGYAPFYGAAKVVDQFRDSPKPIMIHCHAGVNRAPSVAYAVMTSDGLSDNEIARRCPLFGLDMPDIFITNRARGCIPQDVIPFLTARHAHPTFGITGLLAEIKSSALFGPHFRKRSAQPT